MALKTQITAIGPDVADLIEGGVLILFAEGAPAELAEVSVLHKVISIDPQQPQIGAMIQIGDLNAKVTAIGEYAWKKVVDIGHVVINFNNAAEAERPGEICTTALDAAALMAALTTGQTISIS